LDLHCFQQLLEHLMRLSHKNPTAINYKRTSRYHKNPSDC